MPMNRNDARVPLKRSFRNAVDMLKLYFSPTSPYVRKVMIVASFLGVRDEVELLPCNANPIDRDRAIVAFNPLAKVPSARTPDGLNLYDSRVICEYLDSTAAVGGAGLFPAEGPARWVALTQQALGDGLMDAALLARYESFLRPEEFRWPAWMDGQVGKIDDCLAEIENQAPKLSVTQCTIGEVTIACALGYLDLRFDALQWRAKCPQTKEWYEQFAALPSVASTAPPSS